MKTEQIFSKKPMLGIPEIEKLKKVDPNLILVFGSVDYFKNTDQCKFLKAQFPDSIIIGCSTAGEISNKGVSDNSVVVTAIKSNKINGKYFSQPISDGSESENCGMQLAKQMQASDLKSVFVLGRGLDINGTALVEGMRKIFDQKVVITGGLAGDGGAFQKTYTYLNGVSSDNQIVAVGFYGNGMNVGYDSVGGWKPFGPTRRVTKAVANILYELDGEPALDVYKKYLGDDAKSLPASGLRYPFALLNDNEDTTGIIRTILAIDEKAGSLTFAGDIPQNGLLRLMHTDMVGLVDGARKAAEGAFTTPKSEGGVGILVSCVGRKIVLGDDIDNEIDAVKAVFGSEYHITGFYSYGEICPLSGFTECKLHNQTMTITWFTDAG